MPKRRRKKKSAPSGDASSQTTPQPAPTSEGSPGKEDSPSTPKKKSARRRRKKKPTEATSAAEPSKSTETAKEKGDVQRARERRAQEQKPRRKRPERKASEPTTPPLPAPARGRRTGLGASGQPRKGRSSASLQPPAPVAPSGARKPPRPKPAPSTTREQTSKESRPGRDDTTRKSQRDADEKATSKKPEGKRAEHKKPVAKARATETKTERTEKKPPRRKRKSETRPAESQPEATRKETEPTSEVQGEQKRRRKRKKARDAQRMTDDGHAAKSQPDSAATEAKPTAEVRGESKRKKPRKKARDTDRESAKGPPAKPRPELAEAEAPMAAKEEEKQRPKKKRKKAPDKEPQPERKRRELPPFGDLTLSDDMLEALADAGYQDPTPVQAGVIPMALEGRDLMGQARTGTGKTAAFGIPLLEKFAGREKRDETAALILVPTRELAVQVRDELTKLASRSKVTTVAVYGGKPIRGQIEHLRRGAEIVVGTPGRVIDLTDRRALNLSALECVVLDEADRMLDIGFRPDIEKILRRCPQSRQTLLLSATIPPPVKRLAERYMYEPEMLDFSPQDVAVETIEQFYFTVDPRQKFDLLMKLIEREDPKQAIVFCRTKKGTDRVGTRLSRKLKGAAVIHGDLQQRQRDRVMADFRAGKVRFLVATDVVGRGIDVSGISHIINFDVPEFCDDYVHRVGRTGRMGREGVAYTFVSTEEGNQLTRIEMRINRLLVRDEIPGFLAIPKPEPTEDLNQPDVEPPKPKPVFGKRTRRIRRAL